MIMQKNFLAMKSDSLPDISQYCTADKVLSHSTIRVPYEVLNKTYRFVQKQIDKDISAVTKSSDDLLTATTSTEVNSILTGVIDKLSKLKRKANEGIGEELNCLKSARRRLDHLKNYDNVSDCDMKYREKQRMICMMVDYFLRHGYYSSAAKLSDQYELADVTNVTFFSSCQSVEQSLKNYDTAPAINWCADHRSKLRKLNSNFEFLVRLQEFVKIVSSGDKIQAVLHARKHLSTADENEERNKYICEAMALLALPQHENVPQKYKYLTQDSSWDRLIEKFRETNCAVFSISSCSVFCAAFQAGLSAMKTNQCGKENRRSLDCPVCQPLLGKLAQSLPRAQFTQSQLICYISGSLMTDDNMPMALPNGYIYSKQALTEMAAKNNNKVTCPRTKEVFELTDAKKVYIM